MILYVRKLNHSRCAQRTGYDLGEGFITWRCSAPTVPVLGKHGQVRTNIAN